MHRLNFAIGAVEKAYNILIKDYQRIIQIPVEKWRETSGLFYFYIVERMPEIYRAKHEFNKSIEASNIALYSLQKGNIRTIP